MLKIEYIFQKQEYKETILFVHGLGGNASQYESQIEYFKKSYNVLSISLRGHGYTNYLLKQEDFTLSNMCDDIFNLLNLLKIKKVHFVGHSMGGNIGYLFIKKYKKNCNSLTTFGTTPIVNKSFWIVKLFNLIYRFIPMKYIATVVSYSGKTVKSKQKIYDMISKTPKKTIQYILPNLVKIDDINILKQRKDIPYLIIKGEFDNEINHLLDKSIKQLKCNIFTKEIKNAGHYVNLDTPEEFNRVLKNFVCCPHISSILFSEY